jgi:hypothetical protein
MALEYDSRPLLLMTLSTTTSKRLIDVPPTFSTSSLSGTFQCIYSTSLHSFHIKESQRIRNGRFFARQRRDKPDKNQKAKIILKKSLETSSG